MDLSLQSNKSCLVGLAFIPCADRADTAKRTRSARVKAHMALLTSRDHS